MRKTILSVCAAILLLVCVSCSSARSLVGTWSSETTLLGVSTETRYTFRSDGTGTVANVVNLDFTYKTSGDTLYVTTSVLGVETTQKYTFSIEGSTLTLNGDYETISLIKQ